MAWLNEGSVFDEPTQDFPMGDPNEPLPDPQADLETPQAAETLEVNRRVIFAGQEFEIDEPDTATILAMLNWVGLLGVRANRFTGQSFKGLFIEETKDGKKSFVPPAETTLWSMLSVIAPSDLGQLAVLAFFGGGRDAQRAGKAWIESVPERDFKVAPIIKALAYRIALAEDLREALKNLQAGTGLINLFQTKKESN